MVPFDRLSRISYSINQVLFQAQGVVYSVYLSVPLPFHCLVSDMDQIQDNEMAKGQIDRHYTHRENTQLYSIKQVF